MKNKRGTTLFFGFMLIFLSIGIAIFLGVAVFGFDMVNSILSIDVDLGNGVNLKTVSEATFGQINSALLDKADTLGIIMLFGMCLLMILNGYLTGSGYPKLFFVIDFFLLGLFFIPAIYISQVYEIFINSTDILTPTFINIIPKTSKFVLNLPVIVGTTGIITMILTYAKIGKPKKGGSSVAGF